MKAVERGRNDWIVVLIVLVIGFLCVLAAGQLALRFAPGWRLNTNMDSHLDPNSDFLTYQPSGFIEAVDPSILTQPSWLNIVLTPGASFATGTPFPSIHTTSSPVPTIVPSMTTTAVVPTSPTNTLVYFPPTRTATSRPSPISTTTSTQVPTLPTTLANTATETATGTATATATPTVTSEPLPPEIGTNPDGKIYTLASGGTLTLNITTFVNDDIGVPDLVYYEFDNMGLVYMDWVIIQVGDGLNWYSVFNWGDNIADSNTNLDFNSLPPPTIPPFSPQEADTRAIPLSSFRNNSGIEIDLDSFVPQGIYSWILIIAPIGDADNQLEIDAIESLP